MLFITNKTIQGKEDNVTFVEGNELSNSLHFCQLKAKHNFEVIGSEPFMKNLKDHCSGEILFYIHGFNNQPNEVLKNAKAIQKVFNNINLGVLVVPFIWPCDNDFGIIKDYWDDQDSAESSGRFFSRSISKLLNWQDSNQDDPCMKRMHMLSHSMGNRVLMKMLDHWRKHASGGQMPYLFTNVFMLAADTPNESLEKHEEGHSITMSARRVHCFYANDDTAMTASKISNMKNRVFTRRLGHTGPERIAETPDNVFAINCDSFNNAFDLKGHTYFLPDKKGTIPPALDHIISMIKRKNIELIDQKITL
jgi:esterase/lipase superfamily enzyme